MSKTKENLKTAFAGESQANRKYLAFAKKAESEGKPNLARLFRATAQGETVHALNHFRNLGEVKSSAENLKVAIAGETYEIESMYPEFVADAQAEGEKAAEIGLAGALAVEKSHQKVYQQALIKIEAGQDLEIVTYHVCEICGELFIGEVPENCPICKAPKDKFMLIV